MRKVQGRNAGKLGAIIAEGKDDDKYFKTNVGSGFTDLQREEFWEKKTNFRTNY